MISLPLATLLLVTSAQSPLRPSCEASGTIGLERIASQNVPPELYAGGRLNVRVELEHGAAQTTDAAKTDEALRTVHETLAKAGWLVAESGSPMSARVERTSSTHSALILSLVAAPPSSGEHKLQLPPLPILVRQPSGQLATLCTAGAEVTVRDPTDEQASTPRASAPPLSEFETWQAARYAIAAAAVLFPLLLWLAWYLWRRRQATSMHRIQAKVSAYANAESTLQGLSRDESSSAADFADRATDALRLYLQDAHTIRAMEWTSEELVARLEKMPRTAPHAEATRAWLAEADALKFAAKQATPAERKRLAEQGIALLRAWEKPA